MVVAGGWHHVVNRGNRREVIFRSDTDRRRFLSRLAELPGRFRTEIHAFVLMDNHHPLLLRTQDACDLGRLRGWNGLGAAGNGGRRPWWRTETGFAMRCCSRR